MLRLVMMLAAAGVGYHLVTTPSSDLVQGVSIPDIPSVKSVGQVYGQARSLVGGFSNEFSSAAREARKELPPDLAVQLDRAAAETHRAVSEQTTALRAPSACGQPDQFGNLKYCFGPRE